MVTGKYRLTLRVGFYFAVSRLTFLLVFLRRVTSPNLPMTMRFRNLKENAKKTVGVFRSDIHSRGLFCLRDIDAEEMVIEYAGEVNNSSRVLV